jgi:O-antigen/teichoic acid export membrane protein
MQWIARTLRINDLHPGLKKYLFNTGWVFAEKALRLVSGLFVGAAVARYLGPARYGLLNYAISLIAFCTAITGMGMDQLLVRELTRHPERKFDILGTGFGLKFSMTLLVVSALIVLSNLYADRETALILCIIGGGLLFENLGVIDYYFQSQVSAKYSVWAQITSLSIISITRIFLVVYKASLPWFALTYALDYFLMGMGFLYFYIRNHNPIFKWRFDRALAKKMFRDCWPMIFATLSVAVYMKIDQVMIKWMLGDAATGQYGVAVRLCELWYFIPMAICASVFPAILKSKAVSEELYLSRFQKLYDLMVAISAGIALPTTLVSGWVVRLLFGEAYAQAAGVLNLYIWAGVFVFLGVANTKWLVSENLQMFIMYSLFGAAVMNVVLNLVLIPAIGLEGAAVATLISYAFGMYFSFLFTKRTRPTFIALTKALYIPGMIKRNIRPK